VQHCCEIEIEISFEISCDIVFEISFEASSFLASVLPSTLSAVNLFKLFLPAEKNAMLRDFVGGSIEALDRALNRNFRKIKDFELDFELVFESLCSARDCVIARAQCLQSLVAIFPNDLSASGLESAYNILVSAVVLSIVY
jgi:hypothetical protein